MLKIVRGRIYHDIISEMGDLICSRFTKLDNLELIKQFESKFANRIGVKYAKTMPFARYALYSILQFKKFPKGTEIIMPPITIKPMVDIVLMCGLKPIFVDIELDTLSYDLGELEKSITVNTKAILFTYLFGIVPDMDKLISLCISKDLFIIEDFSHTLNATYNNKKIGTFGDVSLYSSSSLKTVDTYMGGTIFTNDKKLYKFLEEENNNLPIMPRTFLSKKIILNMIRNIFSKSIVFTFITNPLLKMIHNLNEEMYKKVLGARLNLKPVSQMPEDWKYKFTSLQAKRGIIRLDKVDKVDKEKIYNVNLFKQYINEKYYNLLPKDLENTKNVYWQYPIYIEKKEEFIKYIEKYNLDMGTTNLSLCSHLDIYSKYNKYTPNALKVKENYFFIPTYQGLSTKQIKYISNVISSFLEEYCD